MKVKSLFCSAFLIIMGIICIASNVKIIFKYTAAEAVVTDTRYIGSSRSARKEISYRFEVDGVHYEGSDDMKFSFKVPGDKFTVYYLSSNPYESRVSDAVWLKTAIGIAELFLGAILLLTVLKKDEEPPPFPEIQ